MQLARKLLYGGIIILLVAGALLLATDLHASAYQPGVLEELSSIEVPTAKQEPCLHCHIQGEHTNLWTPTARWLVFGTLGLVFLFGFWQSASIWTQRKAFKPLTTVASEWVEERFQIAKPLNEILKKPVPSFARWWWYCLGGITFFLFVIQGTTGIMLAFYYKPTAAEAYASIQFIENEVYFGAAIRAIHHWSANGMIVMCIAHMLRVFIMGAYKAPRELNWVSGVLLLVLTLAFGFTGYLLPWDQRAFWASTVGTEIAGAVPAVGNLVLIFLRDGWGVTEATLGRFYGLHVLVVPIATVAFMLAHFVMVRRLGVKRPL
jgi:cytochrome b6